MVTLTLAGLNVHRILVDGMSSVNVLYKNKLDKLRIGSLELKPVHIPLFGFIVVPITLVGDATLPLSIVGN